MINGSARCYGSVATIFVLPQSLWLCFRIHRPKLLRALAVKNQPWEGRRKNASSGSWDWTYTNTARLPGDKKAGISWYLQGWLSRRCGESLLCWPFVSRHLGDQDEETAKTMMMQLGKKVFILGPSSWYFGPNNDSKNTVSKCFVFYPKF